MARQMVASLMIRRSKSSWYLTLGAIVKYQEDLAAQPFEILLVLDDGTERRLDSRLAEFRLAQRDQRASPVQRLSNPGQLIEVETPNAADECAHLAGQLLGDLRHAGRDDLVLAIHGGVIDPEVQAAALEGIVDLAGSIRGDDHRRRLISLDGADLRD